VKKKSLRFLSAHELPASRSGRIAVFTALAVGGLVALLVPVFFAVMLFGMLTGE
jgi:hypothetical protein